MILLNGTTAEELDAQAALLAQLTGAPVAGATPPPGAPAASGATPPSTQLPPRYPNPGQLAGNSPTPPTATVQAGRDRYRQEREKRAGRQPA